MIKKSLAVFLLSLLILVQSVSAITVNLEDEGSVVIKELGIPATFNLEVSSGIADTYEIYSFNGVTFSPRGSFDLPSGKSDTELKVYPNSNILKLDGFYDFEYQLKGQQTGIYSGKMRIKLVSLSSTLSLDASPIEVSDSMAYVTITNTQNTKLDDVKIRLRSPFFDETKTFSLDPYKSTIVNVSIDEEKQSTLKAGPYIVSGEVQYQGAKSEIEGTVEYVEEENVVSSSDTTGVLVRDTELMKSNEGNVISQTTLTTKRDALSRLFTTFSREPTSSERNGFSVTYNWDVSLKPGEADSVVVSTNYTFPFIIIVLIVLVTIFVRNTTKTNVEVRKGVSFVRTKGGEFALKVSLTVNAKTNVEKLQIIDTIPAVMKLYHQYGRSPDRVDAQTRRLFWNIDRLDAGESRVFSYVIYSNIRAVGRFELPSAMAVFDKEGKTHEVYSNRAFFASNTVKA